MANESSKYRDMLDIIFEDRNKAYGAYVLRREYPKYLTRAVVYMLIGMAVLFAAPYILASVAGVFADKKPTDIEIKLEAPPDIDPNTPPPPPPPPVETPPPPVRSTAALVEMIAKKDEEVPEDKVQDIEDIKDKDVDISDKDVEGDKDAPIDDPIIVAPKEVEEKKPEPVEDVVHDYVEKPPSFPGGEAELLKYLNENIKYPPLAKESNIQGRAILSFVVSRSGKIEEVRIIKEPGGGCGKEAVRVVQSMPSWNPGEQNGHPVKVRYTLPVLFRLE